MTSIAEVGDSIKMVLSTTADEAARPTHFVQRRSKVSGSLFAQTLVLGWLRDPQSSLEGLAQTASSLGADITPQALDQRFSREAVAFLKVVLNSAVTQIVSADSVAIPILGRFTGVFLQDSSIIPLPGSLVDVWPGCGNASKETAALKTQVRLDISTGALQGPLLQNGRTQDRSSPFQAAPLPPGALRLADLGFFSLDVLGEIDSQGAFFLSRLQVQTTVADEDGNPLDLLELLQEQGSARVDIPVRIGIKARLPVRLLAVRVDEAVANERRRKLKDEARRRGQNISKARLRLADWTVYVTNAPAGLLSLDEALVLARARWQIELLFKLWKQHGQIDQWKSIKPWRILCEVYAKLTAMVIQHWLLLVSFWTYPDRSMVKASQTVRGYGLLLAIAMTGAMQIDLVVEQISQCLAKGCRMNSRLKHPNTYQLLLDPTCA